MAVDPFSEPISKLSDTVLYVIKTTSNFKPQLRQLTKTLDTITPIMVDIQNQNRKLDRTRSEQDMFMKDIEDAKKLVEKCSRIKWNLILKFTHSLKLKDVSQKLLNFFQVEVQADQWRDIKKVLVEVDSVNERLASLSLGLSSGSMRMSMRRCETAERRRFGWLVPPLPKGIVGFDEPLNKLKAKILEGINVHDVDDDGSAMDCDDGSEMDCDDGCGVGNVVVVSGVGGDGKTTLVKMLCNDHEIQANFGENIFFVTVSEEFDYKVSVNGLFNPSHFDQQGKFQSTEDAKNELENFLREKVLGPILLVLDDVWRESDIKNFEFDIKGYKLLVTSRMVFTKYDVFKFDPLSDEDAKILFCRSAKPNPTIDKNLINQMVKCCKKHPLTLSVVGGSLDGKNEVLWRSMLKSLSQGQSLLDLNKEILNRLERSFETLEDKFKQCFLDFGLFLEDHRIPASAILDMWVHLYNHDDEGIDTLAKIYELSYRNLVNVLARRPREDPYAPVNYCEQQFVTQHDLLRQLAINLSSKLPVAKRRRLIITEQNDQLVTNVLGEDQVTSVEQLQEPMQARVLSISTGESFSSRWCDMRVPEVEVMVLNLKSKTYTLPHFLKEMQKLKILNVTNYGLYPTEFKNFQLLGYLSNLTRIRLERVAISSLSRSTLELVNLQKVSFIMCKMRNAFEDSDNLNVWPSLVEIEMDYCQDLVIYPQILCRSVYLKKLSITNCNELCKISEKFGNLTGLETLILHSCTQLEKLPESITRLQNLSILDISDCLNLTKLPEDMGSLGGLRTICMAGFTGVHELPASVKELSNTKVVCNEEVACQWKEFGNVEITVVEEDRTATLERIIC
ncbi:putative powdery mildew resistance protein, RPW8 [Helianthus annuus]|uniref:Powdery mildew resistance protein, RPW8 n=1 Tax=Helianthus annuus TaxID=4232 RepID=A0A251VGD4_HELAN|nr:probable disease resistance protein At5g66910 [Helianthus annuus]KAF5818775.1 putative powdery mildew resistance protein, RPW8 [Helianthus annuus]KAJ0605013.1 putative powdery mildew resistance protein, RPW8 [Helianthus annuus]KAJ0619026.1 putative powdery mildew resistance protein, RPW8 [Helianthus annuus]KAJ0777479.1 putative powdery mildew resistance protein, RPW8 [Helianthus annuus]KAJ0952081.1 putative powdery mildew resistance protein, RPW8 [Helianthus annuus]